MAGCLGVAFQKGVLVSTSTIRAEYDDLKQVAQAFDNLTVRTNTTKQNLTDARNGLNGEWVGFGADRFFGEMENDILPSVQRLENALAHVADLVREISKQFLEQETADAQLILKLSSNTKSPIHPDIAQGLVPPSSSNPTNTKSPIHPDIAQGLVPPSSSPSPTETVPTEDETSRKDELLLQIMQALDTGSEIKDVLLQYLPEEQALALYDHLQDRIRMGLPIDNVLDFEFSDNKVVQSFNNILESLLGQFDIEQDYESIPFLNVASAAGLALLGYDSAELQGDVIKMIQADPEMIKHEQELIQEIMNDPLFGKEAFTGSNGGGVEFGGQRAEGEMGEQLFDLFNPENRQTWEVASNELTWLLRHASVSTTYTVSETGQIQMNHTLNDTLDLRPSENRSLEYNIACIILGEVYHDWFQGTELDLSAEWQVNHNE